MDDKFSESDFISCVAKTKARPGTAAHDRHVSVKDPVLQLKWRKKQRQKSFALVEPAAYSERQQQLLARCDCVQEPPAPWSKSPLTPTFSLRTANEPDKPFVFKLKRYVVPLTKRQQREKAARHDAIRSQFNFCKYDVLRLPSPPSLDRFDDTVVVEPGQPAAVKTATGQTPKVFPEKPSSFEKLFPRATTKKDLQLRKPKSGIIINEGRPVRIVKRPKKPKHPPVEEIMPITYDDYMDDYEDMYEGEEEYAPPPIQDDYEKKIRPKNVEMVTKSTSFLPEDIMSHISKKSVHSTAPPPELRFITQPAAFLMPRESCTKRTCKSRPRSVECLDSFYFGSKLGTKYQSQNFGMCTPLAAYCYAMIKHPSQWTAQTIDDILDFGRAFFEQIGVDEPTVADMPPFLPLGGYKVKFQVDEPQISGTVRSKDRRIFTLVAAIRTFFRSGERAGIIQTCDENFALWKDRYWYLFDYGARDCELYQCQRSILMDRAESVDSSGGAGAAALAHFHTLKELCSVLLNKTDLCNKMFVIYGVRAFRVMAIDKVEEVGLEETYEVSASGAFAVLCGSWDLSHRYFGFSRNKQALLCSLVAIVYAKVAPSSAWTRNTLNKVMTLANQVHIRLCKQMHHADYELDMGELPAIFEIGPYCAEVYIKPNIMNAVFDDSMFNGTVLANYFECNHNAIMTVGTPTNKCTVAMWKQREIYYCFDPYHNTEEGTHNATGVACISMHPKPDSMVQMILNNFSDPCAGDCQTFELHSIKYCSLVRGSLDHYLACAPCDYCIKRAIEGDSTKLKVCSITKIAPNVQSIELDLCGKVLPNWEVPKKECMVDLDAASLSDTQIEPIRPATPSIEEEEEEEMAKEMHGEDWNEEDEGGDGDEEDEEGDEGEGDGGEDGPSKFDFYFAKSVSTGIGSRSLLSEDASLSDSKQAGSEESDDLLGPREILPANRFEIPEKFLNVNLLANVTETYSITQSEEMLKESNFYDLPDGSQILRGTQSIGDVEKDVDIAAPFVSIAAVIMAKKYSISTWSKEIVDYTLITGQNLFKASSFRFDQVHKIDIPLIALGNDEYSVQVTYAYDGQIKPQLVQKMIAKHLPQPVIFVTANYSCAIIEKHHVYYLYDGFASSEIGLGLSISGRGQGAAFLARFKTLESLTAKLLHNKDMRLPFDAIDLNKFVLSVCNVNVVVPEDYDKIFDYYGEDDAEDSPQPLRAEPINLIGYQEHDGEFVIEGTEPVPDASGDDARLATLTVDYFICIVACLKLFNNPIVLWETRMVDEVVHLGRELYERTMVPPWRTKCKHYVRNVLVDGYFFDIIIREITSYDYAKRANYLLLQLTTKYNLLYRHQITSRCGSAADGRRQHQSVQHCTTVTYHRFDPCAPKAATWTLLPDDTDRIQRLVRQSGWFSFEITSFRKAAIHKPFFERSELASALLPSKPDLDQTKPFNEDITWLALDPVPWSPKVLAGLHTLFHWNQIYVNDLYALYGTKHQIQMGPEPNKQTLANLLTAIAMANVYPLNQWCTALVNQILISGQEYFDTVVRDIDVEDYELSVEDFGQQEFTVSPFTFTPISFVPLIDGTVFSMHCKRFNLFKALRYFFAKKTRRDGIITLTYGDLPQPGSALPSANGDNEGTVKEPPTASATNNQHPQKRQKKMHLAFGRVGKGDYYMFDCQSFCMPLFHDGEGVAYALRTTSINRLLHVLVLTLKGGDFYIFEVNMNYRLSAV